MIEFVFRPSRTVAGRRVVSRLFSGRYAVEKGARVVTVRLTTPDREIAKKRFREIVLEKQREQEGIISPKAVRVAAAAQLGALVSEYEVDLRGRGLDEKHVHDSVTRLRRMLAEAGWNRLADIRADAFVRWRAALGCSAKTVKEYQVSACAFLNWLVRTDRLAVNPLAKVDKIDVRGKQVRASRTYTEPELARLFSVAGRYVIGYQVLLYTARRWSEVYALVWGDLHLDDAEPFALFREGTTKDKDKLRRAVEGRARRSAPGPSAGRLLGHGPGAQGAPGELRPFPEAPQAGRHRAQGRPWLRSAPAFLPQDLADPRRALRRQPAGRPGGARALGRQPDREGVHRRAGARPHRRGRKNPVDSDRRRLRTNKRTKIRNSGSFPGIR